MLLCLLCFPCLDHHMKHCPADLSTSYHLSIAQGSLLNRFWFCVWLDEFSATCSLEFALATNLFFPIQQIDRNYWGSHYRRSRSCRAISQTFAFFNSKLPFMNAENRTKGCGCCCTGRKSSLHKFCECHFWCFLRALVCNNLLPFQDGKAYHLE